MHSESTLIIRVSHAFAILLWCASPVLLIGPAQAQVSRTLSYQGYLTSPSRASITNPALSLTFKLYPVALGECSPEVNLADAVSEDSASLHLNCSYKQYKTRTAIMAITLTSFAENWTSAFKNINSTRKVVR